MSDQFLQRQGTVPHDERTEPRHRHLVSISGHEHPEHDGESSQDAEADRAECKLMHDPLSQDNESSDRHANRHCFKFLK